MAGRPHKTTKPAIQRKIQQMVDAGINNADIARTIGMDRSSVGRYLDKYLPQIHESRRYVEARADLLDQQQALAASVAMRVLEQLSCDDLSQLTPGQKASMLPALTMQQGTMYDKSRLERGQSTANVALVSVDLSEYRRPDDAPDHKM